MEFEWDENKARVNLRKHGVSFDRAKLVFEDEQRVEEIDDSIFYGEERWRTIGMVWSELVVVIYTERQGKIRIISARRALKHEQQDYYQQT